MKPELTLEPAEAIAEREALLERVLNSKSGVDWCVQHTDLVDGLVRGVARSVSQRFPGLTPISVVATGGYGRRELAPHSDVDLTVIPLDEADVHLDEAVRQLYLSLQEALEAIGLEMGYAFRLVTDVPGLDAKSRTGLIDGRLVSGSHVPFEALNQLFWDTFPVGEFLIAKIGERQASFAKTNDTPLAVQPQLKEGAGGLRCFHAANWIGAAIGERAAVPDRAYDRVLQMRNVLHRVAGRRVDLFSRARQSEVADALGLELFPMMSSLAEDLLSLHARYERAVDSLLDARFSLSEGVLSIRGEARVKSGATAASAAAGIAVATSLGIRVADLPAGAHEIGDGAAAVEAFARGESTIRNLDKCEVLQSLIPELTRCRTLMPTDTMHDYSVFEHTLRVIRNLDAASSDQGYLTEVRESISDLGALYLAALLHDVGKQDASRPHSEIGSEMAIQVCQRLGLAPLNQELVSWLVREHLAMSHAIQMRDIQNPATIRDFAHVVRTPDRLAMLTLLTWADIAAVAPGSLTPVQESLLKGLYESTLVLLTKREESESDAAAARKQMLKRITGGSESEQAVAEFVQSLPAYYLLGTPPERIREHLRMVRAAAHGDPIVSAATVHDAAATEFTICCPDTSGLLSRILGVFYAFDLSLIGLRASTTESEPRIALDVFTTTFGDRVVPAATSTHVQKALQKALAGDLDSDELLRQRGKDPDRQQQIFQHTFLEGSPGILEIRAPKGRGMAYRISRLIAAHGWNTVAARVGQWAGRGAAAFYITGSQGEQLSRAEVDAALKGQV